MFAVSELGYTKECRVQVSIPWYAGRLDGCGRRYKHVKQDYALSQLPVNYAGLGYIM